MVVRECEILLGMLDQILTHMSIAILIVYVSVILTDLYPGPRAITCNCQPS